MPVVLFRGAVVYLYECLIFVCLMSLAWFALIDVVILLVVWVYGCFKFFWVTCFVVIWVWLSFWLGCVRLFFCGCACLALLLGGL